MHRWQSLMDNHRHVCMQYTEIEKSQKNIRRDGFFIGWGQTLDKGEARSLHLSCPRLRRPCEEISKQICIMVLKNMHQFLEIQKPFF